MIRPFISAALALTVLFGLIVGGLHLQPRPDPAAPYLVGCAMPCWNGIAPGVTPQERALTALNRAIGVDPYEASCSFPLSNVCERYMWTSADGSTPYAELAIERSKIEALIVYTPHVTLGDALLTLRGLRVPMDGAYPGFKTDQTFYLQFLFAHSNLILRASAPCPGSYLDLMETPIRTVEVDAPNVDAQVGSTTSFGTVRATFAQTCS